MTDAVSSAADRRPGRLAVWVLTARPKTLTAAVVPVLVGGATAFRDGAFAALPWAAALLGAMLIQIGTNFANDVFDYEQGADTPDRLGPTRAVASGLLSPQAVRNAMIATFGAAVGVGIYLVARGGWPVVAIGVASVLSGIFYTATRRSLAYLGLGDLFVLIFFGGVAVAGTHYVQALQVSPFVLWASVPVGAWATNIIVVNNLRDRNTDAQAGKRTLAVRFGRRFCLVEYGLLAALSYAVPLALAVRHQDPRLALPLLSVPLALALFGQVRSTEGRALNPLLGRTARMLLVHGCLWVVAIAWAP